MSLLFTNTNTLTQNTLNFFRSKVTEASTDRIQEVTRSQANDNASKLNLHKMASDVKNTISRQVCSKDHEVCLTV